MVTTVYCCVVLGLGYEACSFASLGSGDRRPAVSFRSAWQRPELPVRREGMHGSLRTSGVQRGGLLFDYKSLGLWTRRHTSGGASAGDSRLRGEWRHSGMVRENRPSAIAIGSSS